MALNIDIGFASLASRKDTNEDFCASMLPELGQERMGSMVAIADRVSAGGMGKEAAQTTVVCADPDRRYAGVFAARWPLEPAHQRPDG